MRLRVLSYNVWFGGAARAAALADVIAQSRADIVVLQEATSPEVVATLATTLGFAQYASRPGQSLAFLSRIPVAHYEWHKPRQSRHAFLEIVPAGDAFRIFGLHLSAVHAAWTERRRVDEVRALIASIAHHQHGFHLLVGDFNTVAPNESLKVRALPLRLQLLVLASGWRIRWRAIQTVVDAGYVDGFRLRHPADPGLTFPVWSPHVRLDYAFVPAAFASRLVACDVMKDAPADKASDHFALLTEVDID